MVLNINVPGVPRDDVKGVHWADLDDFGTFRVAIAEDSRLQFVLGSPDNNSDPGCDTVLCSENHVTITPLSGVEPAPFPKEDAGVVAGYATSGTG